MFLQNCGNGAEAGEDDWWDWWNTPDNIITLSLDSVQAVGQENGANLNNDLTDLDAKLDTTMQNQIHQR